MSNARYGEFSHKLQDILSLKRLPVALKLIRTNEKPEGFKEPEKPIRYCISVYKASEGEMLILPKEKHACLTGANVLGLTELPSNIRSGEAPYRHGLFKSIDVARRAMSEIPRVNIPAVTATLVAPLERMPLNPDVVLLICNPKQAMLIANAFVFEQGGPTVRAGFTGAQALCGYTTAVPYISKQPNFSLGCYGCRLSAKIADEDMYCGIPVEMMGSFIQNLMGLEGAVRKIFAQ